MDQHEADNPSFFRADEQTLARVPMSHHTNRRSKPRNEHLHESIAVYLNIGLPEYAEG